MSALRFYPIRLRYAKKKPLRLRYAREGLFLSVGLRYGEVLICLSQRFKDRELFSVHCVEVD